MIHEQCSRIRSARGPSRNTDASGLRSHCGERRSEARGRWRWWRVAGPRLIRYGAIKAIGQMSGYSGRNVIDRTGITGKYAINLSFAPVDPGAPVGDAAQDFAPSIFQALQDQAGRARVD